MHALQSGFYSIPGNPRSFAAIHHTINPYSEK
jgi:hypothetical protein